MTIMMVIMYTVKRSPAVKISREQVEANRRRILDAAGRLFREHGFEAVTVSEIMKAAGLTHGGFYGHFKSKEDLIAQALEHALTAKPKEEPFDIARYAASYLCPTHRDGVAEGCPIAALAVEATRVSPEARAALTAGVRVQLERFTEQASGTKAQKRRTAIGTWAAMVGALVLARLSDDEALSDELLAQTRAFIREQLAEG